MWMIDSLQRSLFKWKHAGLLILIIAAMIPMISFSINRHLPPYASALRDVINQQLAVKISFSSIHYRFPNSIILKNVTVLPSNSKTPIWGASRMVIGLTLPLSSSGPSLYYVALDDATIDFAALENYWRQHSARLSTWARTLPQDNLRLLVPNGRFTPKDKTRDPFPFKIDFSLKHNHVTAKGFWEDKDKFNYELYGDRVKTGFILSKLNVESGQSSVNLWGQWQDNTIDWKGFIFYKKFYILDINGHCNIQDTDIVLKGLSFSVNGDDVTLSGHCSKEKLFQCDADMSLSRQKQHLDAEAPLKNMHVRLYAQNTPQGLVFNGQTDLDFLFDPNAPLILQSMHLDFKNLKARIMNTELLRLKINHMEISWVSHEEHKISAENFLVGIHWPQVSHAIITLSARMCSGRYRGRIFVDTTAMPWQIKGQGRIDAIDITRLSSTFSFFQQCDGIVSGHFDLQSLKNMRLTGALIVHHGDFNDFTFMPWVAQTLQMPTLNHLSGADLSCHFKIDGNSKMLEDLNLRTQDLNLNGFFHLDAEDLVSSRMAVRFSKELLGESPIGRSILGMVQDAGTLPFEFRLSGNLYRMNFQWDHSPLKDKVHQHMFAFVERMVDRRMNANPYTLTQNPGF